MKKERKEKNMMKLLAAALGFMGGFVSTTGTQGCNFLLADEPKMPKSLIEK